MIFRDMSNIAKIQYVDSRSISAENPDGKRGFGGQASGELGKGRKGKAYLDLEPDKETTILISRALESSIIFGLLFKIVPPKVSLF